MRRSLTSFLFAIALSACSNTKDAAPAAASASPKEHANHRQASASATPPSPEAHQDHDARHGGVLTMEGDVHIEIVVSADGAIDLYLSDAARRPIPPKEASGTIVVAGPGGKDKQTLALAEDPAKGSLSAKGPPPNGTEYTWKLTVRGAPMSTTLDVPAGGTAALAKPPADREHPSGAHAHGSPHGGEVQTLADGHVEVKLDKSGEVTLWMLDPSEKPRPAKGVSATIRPVVAGSKEVALVYEEKSDTLRGKVDAVSQPHVDAIVSVTPAGGRPTSLRFKFHLEGAGNGSH